MTLRMPAAAEVVPDPMHPDACRGSTFRDASTTPHAFHAGDRRRRHLRRHDFGIDFVLQNQLCRLDVVLRLSTNFTNALSSTC
jgi:hypothetical protein